MKTYILKHDVNNDIVIPAGTVVKITDDYWKSGNSYNTGFTVVEGKLKDEKGCVAAGLEGWLIEDTVENRRIFKARKIKLRAIEKIRKKVNARWEDLKPAKL